MAFDQLSETLIKHIHFDTTTVQTMQQSVSIEMVRGLCQVTQVAVECEPGILI